MREKNYINIFFIKKNKLLKKNLISIFTLLILISSSIFVSGISLEGSDDTYIGRSDDYKQNIQIPDNGLTVNNFINQTQENIINLYIIQFSGAIRPSWKEQIVSIGAEIIGYLGDFNFLINYNEPTNDEIINLPFVTGFYPYDHQLKYSHERFDNIILSSDITNLDLIIQYFSGFSESITLQYLTTRIGQLGGTIIDYSNNRIMINIPSNKLLEIAQLENVIWLEPAPKFRYFNDVTSGLIDTKSVWNNLGLDGTGQIVTVCDTGLDNGSYSNLHMDFRGRLLFAYARGRTSDWSDDDISMMGIPVGGHGTHVAGSVLGNGYHSSGKYKGMAYNASLVFQSTMTSTGNMDLPVDLYQGLYYPPFNNNNSNIHTNSWGDPQGAGEYNTYTNSTDSFIWDHKNQIILFAAGNIFGPITKVSPPGTSKNVITVGASESYRATPTFPGHENDCDNADQRASFSCYATNDNRLKPDILCPGTGILSTRSSMIPDPNFHYWKNYDAYYAYAGGTSMATPITAGAVTLIRQFFTDIENVNKPSAALVKATLINGAEDLPASGGTQSIPNYQEGWGRINISKSINPKTPGSFIYFDNKSGLISLKNSTYTIEVLNDSVPLNITLVWSDYPASASATTALVNDLHLNLTHVKTGKSYKGNVFNNGWSHSDDSYANHDWDKYSTGYDNINNVECFRIKKPQLGRYTITVVGNNVPFGPQPFALACSGGLNKELLEPVNIKVEVVPTGNALNLSWDKIHGPNIEGYKIYRSTMPNSSFIGINKTSSKNKVRYQDTGLTDGTQYYYKLKTVYTDNESVFSKVASGIPEDSVAPWINLITPKSRSAINKNFEIQYSNETDCMKIIFRYYNDSNHNDLPDDNNSWISIGTDSDLTGMFYWDTTSSGPGPVNQDSVIFSAETFDEVLNSRFVFVRNLSVDNEPPEAPKLNEYQFNPINFTKITLTGSAEDKSTVKIYSNSEVVGENKTDDNLQFKIGVNLFEGLNEVTARAFDYLGNGPGPQSNKLELMVDTKPPIAAPGGNFTINEDKWFTFNGNNSYDTNPIEKYNNITEYQWLIENPNGTKVYLVGVKPKHFFETMGNYSITLRVKDMAGNWGEQEFWILVRDRTKPLAEAGKDFIWDESKILFLNGRNSSDNDPEFNTSGNFTWEFYDYNIEFLFNMNLNFKKQLIDGLVPEDIINAFQNNGVSLSNNARIISFNNKKWWITDIENKYDIDGTGNKLNITNVSKLDEGKTEFKMLIGREVSYKFVIPGIYNITLRVADSSKNWDTDNLFITIRDLTPPKPNAGPDSLIDQGRTVIFDASQTIDNDPTIFETGNFTWYFNYIGEDIFLIGPVQSFKFKKANVFTIRLTVTDRWGNKNNEDVIVRVNSDIYLPTVEWTYPIDNSWNIPVTSVIKIKLNETLDVQKVPLNLTNFQLLDSQYNQLNGKIRYDPLESIILFIPENVLKFGVSYSVFLSNSLVDLAGNNLDGNGNGIGDSELVDMFKFVFSTMNISRIPDNNMNDVAIDSIITVKFEGNFSKYTLNTANISLINKRSNGMVEGSLEINNESSMIKFIPNHNLEMNTEYKIILHLKFYLHSSVNITWDAISREIIVMPSNNISDSILIIDEQYSWSFETKTPEKKSDDAILELEMISILIIIVVVIIIIILIMLIIIRRKVQTRETEETPSQLASEMYEQEDEYYPYPDYDAYEYEEEYDIVEDWDTDESMRRGKDKKKRMGKGRSKISKEKGQTKKSKKSHGKLKHPDMEFEISGEGAEEFEIEYLEDVEEEREVEGELETGEQDGDIDIAWDDAEGGEFEFEIENEENAENEVEELESEEFEDIEEKYLDMEE